MATGIPARLSTAEGRKFGLTVGGAFLAITGRSSGGAGATGRRRTPARSAPCWSWRALLIPTLLGPVNRAWMGLAHLISKVTTPIFMGVVYFVVLTPIGLGMRLAGRRPLVHTVHDDRVLVRPRRRPSPSPRAWNVNSDSRTRP